MTIVKTFDLYTNNTYTCYTSTDSSYKPVCFSSCGSSELLPYHPSRKGRSKPLEQLQACRMVPSRPVEDMIKPTRIPEIGKEGIFRCRMKLSPEIERYVARCEQVIAGCLTKCEHTKKRILQTQSRSRFNERTLPNRRRPPSSPCAPLRYGRQS